MLLGRVTGTLVASRKDSGLEGQKLEWVSAACLDAARLLALEQLRREGVTVCPHTVGHPLLDRLPPDRIRAEIEGLAEFHATRGLDRIENRLAAGFAYRR